VNIILTFIVLAILAVAYFAWIRPWQLRWGATDEELTRAMPGDGLVTKPSFDATRAVTVQAAPQAIYPWIVQIGVTRAGWYSYDLLDNLGRPSARWLLPEHQQIYVGQLIPMSPDGKYGIYVKEFMDFVERQGGRQHLALGNVPHARWGDSAHHPYTDKIPLAGIDGDLQSVDRVWRFDYDAQVHVGN